MRPFPDLTLPALEGGERRLSSFWSPGPLLVIHGHRTCGTTRLTLSVADRIHRRRTRGEVLVVLQDTREVAAELAKEQGLALPILLEPDPYPLAGALGLTAVPTLTLVGEGGVPQRSVHGFSRTELDAFAADLGVVESLFAPGDKLPAHRPG